MNSSEYVARIYLFNYYHFYSKILMKNFKHTEYLKDQCNRYQKHIQYLASAITNMTDSTIINIVPFFLMYKSIY